MSWGAAPNEPWVQTFGRIRNCFLLQSATSQLTQYLSTQQLSRYIDMYYLLSIYLSIFYLSTPISRTSGRAPAGWVLWTVLWGRQWLVKVSDGTFGFPASSTFNFGHLKQGGNLCCPFNILNTKPGSSINQKYLHLDEWGLQVVRCNVWAVSELNLIPKMKWATECNSNKSLDLKWNFSLNGKVKI